MVTASQLPGRTGPGAPAVLVAALAACALAAATAAAEDPTLPTTFFADQPQVLGLSPQVSSSALERYGPRRVRVPGRPAVPGVLWGWKITYVNGHEVSREPIWTRRPQPAVPPSWKTVRQRVGGVTVACGLEPVRPDLYRATSLSVTADGDRGTQTASAAGGVEPLVRLRARRGRIAARLTAKLDDGSRVRLTGEGDPTSVDAGLGLQLVLRHSTVTGPVVTQTSGRTGSVTGTWTVGAVGGRPDIDVTWQDASRGTVVFNGPATLAGRTGTIRRSPSGAYAVVSEGEVPIEMLVRPDGSGWFDVGYGRLTLPAGGMLRGDGSGESLVDAWDPDDDTADGATPLSPASAGTTPVHSLSRRDREDWFEIDLAAGSASTFRVTPASAQVGILVYGEGPSPLAEGVTPLASGGVAVTAARTGRHRLQVTGSSGAATYAIEWARTSSALTASDGASGDAFGTSVAFDGTTAIVGAPGADAGRGAVYVSIREGDGSWTETQRITASDAGVGGNDGFGESVALDGDTALVGAGTLGAAYALRRSGGTWSEETTLRAGLTGSLLRTPVALDGDTAVVGGGRDADGHGTVGVYVRSGGTWVLEGTLTDPYLTADNQRRYGIAVAVSGDRVLVGADDSFLGRGRVTEYRRFQGVWTGGTTFSLVQTYSYSSEHANFGACIALDGETALIGAPGDEYYKGLAYVAVPGAPTWSSEAILAPSDAEALGNGWSYFATSVALDGDTAVVGMSFGVRGDVYAYARSGTTWRATHALRSPDLADWASFGAALAVRGRTVLVGSPSAGAGSRVNSGAVHVFDLE